jgi:cell division protein FtsB
MHAFSIRSFWLPVFVATLVAALFGAILARRGRHVQRMVEGRAILEARLARLEAENDRLRAERDELLSSPGAIERVAREEYGFAAPGEQIIRIEGEPRRPPAGRGRRTPLSLGERVLMSGDLSVLLPAAVFVATSVVFAVMNLVSVARESRTR